MNAVGVLCAREEEGCVLRDVVGGDEGVDGGQALDKLLRGQLIGQETAKLHQRVLALKHRKIKLCMILTGEVTIYVIPVWCISFIVYLIKSFNVSSI